MSSGGMKHIPRASRKESSLRKRKSTYGRADKKRKSLSKKKPHQGALNTVSQNYGYSLFEEDIFTKNGVQDESNNKIHLDTVGGLIVDNFTNDVDMHYVHSTILGDNAYMTECRPLENLEVPPILHVKEPLPAPPAQAMPRNERPTMPARPP